MQKRGQGAMEFLMTYGWAIIVVLVILSALYFLGVFSPKTVNTYSIEAPFLCNDFFVNNTEVTYLVGAKGISTAIVTDIIINDQSCVNDLNGTIQNGNLVSDQIVQVSCMGIILNPDEKISSRIIIDYSRAGDLPHTISGSGSGVNENSEVSEPPINNAPTIELSSPSDDSFDVFVDLTLSWDGSDLDLDGLTYDIYLNDAPYDDCQNWDIESCNLTGLLYGTNYDWYVIADDGQNQTQSENWSFTTEEESLGFPLTGLVFGWAGNDSSDYIGGLGGTAVNGLIPGNNQSIFFDNNATKFDGSNDGINFGSPSVLDFTSQFAISFWINKNSNSNGGMVSKWTTGGGNNNAYTMTVGQDANNGKLRFSVQESDSSPAISATGVTSPPLGQWTHVVGVANGTRLILYINGVQDGNTPAYDGTIKVVAKNLMVGKLRQEDNIYPFNGLMDEVYIWNRGLSNIEVQELYDYYQS